MVSTDGRRIKEGLLIRSAFLRMLDEEQIEYLDSLNIKYILDLRSTEEAERTARSFTKNHRLMKETKLRTATVKGTLLDDLRALVSA